VNFYGGQVFEELSLGLVVAHQPGRTVTETDNLLFTTMTMNPQPLHLDAEFSRSAEFGQRLVNSIFTLGLVVGLSVGDLTLGTTVGNLGFDKVEFPRPVFIGDTIYAESEVVELRESKSRPQWGVATFEHRGKNQRGEIVVRVRRAAMMRRRPA
jgi:acyl dehydratase